jgi:DNA invertase Pin-like site-specific DNA recombinase
MQRPALIALLLMLALLAVALPSATAQEDPARPEELWEEFPLDSERSDPPPRERSQSNAPKNEQQDAPEDRQPAPEETQPAPEATPPAEAERTAGESGGDSLPVGLLLSGLGAAIAGLVAGYVLFSARAKRRSEPGRAEPATAGADPGPKPAAPAAAAPELEREPAERAERRRAGKRAVEAPSVERPREEKRLPVAAETAPAKPPIAAKADKPEPMKAEKREAAKAEKREPARAEKREPARAEKREPVRAEKAEPVKARKPEPVKVDKPEPVKARKPEPVKVDKPEPVKARKPEPVKVDKPEPVKAEKPEPVKVDKPEPVKAEKPEPVKAEKPEPVKVDKAEPVKAQKPEPSKAQKPEPVKAEKPEPSKAQKPEPVKVEKPEPVKAQKPEPVKADKPEPVKAEKPEPVEPTAPASPPTEVQEPPPATPVPTPLEAAADLPDDVIPFPTAPGLGGRRPPRARGQRALGYVSVTDAEDQAADLEAQTAQIRTACSRNGFESVSVVRDFESHSGSDLERPGLTYALEKLEAGDATCLVVASLERLTRSAAHLGTLIDRLSESAIRLVVLDIQLDTGNPDGRLAAEALANVGTLERRSLDLRTRKGLQAARDSRRSSGRPAVADRPALKQRIAEMRARGMTLQAIADTLNTEGVPTLRGGAEWRPSSVQAAVGYKRPKRGTRKSRGGAANGSPAGGSSGEAG